VLLEALALDVPVVATDCRHGPRELLDGGSSGHLVPVGNVAALARAMEIELRHPSSRRRAVLDTHCTKLITSHYLAAVDSTWIERGP